MRCYFLVSCILFNFVLAAHVEESEAVAGAQGWLNAREGVFGCRAVSLSESIVSCHGDFFYAIDLVPEGYLILSADDRLEPVVAFSTQGAYNSDPANSLNVMLSRTASALEHGINSASAGDELILKNQDKWDKLKAYSDGYIKPMLAETPSISDVCVAPLTQSLWNQLEVCSQPAYNLYTPNNYPAGCVATAMAQLMRFHEYPDFGIGMPSYSIGIDGSLTTVSARGGDGAGGPYDWSLMDLNPSCESSAESIEQIGALCYDAGIAVNMRYSAAVSTAETYRAGKALLETFGYAQANTYFKANYESAYVAVNSNLNAGLPVILGLSTAEYVEPYMGHSVVCDGYGYDLGTVYHHVNMGWSGLDNLWYSFPQMEILSVVEDVVYNVSPDQTGGIISGRVTMVGGGAVEGALITAGELSAYTNASGIYAITGASEGLHSVTAEFAGFESSSREAVIETNNLKWINTCDTDFVIGLAPYTVTFLAGEHGTITSGSTEQLIYDGNRAIAPVVTPDTGWIFIGWDTHSHRITGDTVITALYSDAPYGSDGFELCAISSHYTLSGMDNWYLSVTEKHQGDFSIQSGFIGDDEESSIEVTVFGAAMVSFWKKISSEEIYDCLRFYIDDVQVGIWSGITDWSQVSFTLPTTGPHTLKWSYIKDESLGYGDDCAWLDDVELFTDYQTYTATFLSGEHGSIIAGDSVQSVVAGRDAYPPVVTADEGWNFVGWDGDYHYLTADVTLTAIYSNLPYAGDDFELNAISDFYTSPGASPWIISEQAHLGDHSMRSGVIGDDSKSSIELTVEGVAGVTFWRKVSSEKDYDFLCFYIDDVLMDRWSGFDEDWSEVYYPLSPASPHTLKWSYVKDESFAAGEDCVYIDDITLESEYDTCTATFLAGEYGSITGGGAVQTVVLGRSAVPPAVTAVEDLHFVGWDADYFNLSGDVVVNAIYCNQDYHSDRFERRAITDFYTQSGDVPWVIADMGYLSGYSMCSGDIADEQTSSIEVTVYDAVSVSFMRYVSSEENYDCLKFYIDGEERGNWSGVVNEWREASFVLDPLTPHQLKWTYSKDVSTSEGLDCAFIDDILITRDASLYPDINCDGAVNAEDLALFCEYWLDLTMNIPEGLHSIDLNQDGFVNLVDFAVLASHWLEQS